MVAVTVRVEELPEEIELGLAEMLTVGEGGVAATSPRHPLNSRDNARLDRSAVRERAREKDRGTRISVKASPQNTSVAGRGKTEPESEPVPDWAFPAGVAIAGQILSIPNRPKMFSSGKTWNKPQTPVARSSDHSGHSPSMNHKPSRPCAPNMVKTEHSRGTHPVRDHPLRHSTGHLSS